MTILDTIVEDKKKQLKTLEDEYKDHILSYTAHEKRSLIKAIEKNHNISIIAEIKRGSPSKGLFADNLDIEEQVKIYNSGASAISVLTDENFFFGSFKDLRKVRELTTLPILCKDFIVDKIQLQIAASMGADLVLLIANVLPPKELSFLLNEAHKLGLEVLVEVHTLEEFEKIKDLDFTLCGVNNRNLEDFTVSLDTTKALADYIKASGKLVITESGIHSKSQLEELRPYHIDAALIGESLIKQSSLLNTLKLRKEPVKIKLCGLKTTAQAIVAESLQVDYIGLVFAKSKRQITINQALEIRAQIKQSKLVGVFKNQSPKYIEDIYNSCKLDFIQIHGSFDFNALEIPKSKIIRAIHYKEIHPQGFNSILFDGPRPGSGQSYNCDDINLMDNQNYILAGGLTSGNVVDKLQTLKVQAVDVSSGIEKEGTKDIELMKEFVDKVRSI